MLTVASSIVSAVVLLSPSRSVDAAPTAASIEKTPVGADAHGNADGSIPPWLGGMTSPPPGWQPGQGYIDPFSAEKPLYTLTAANAAEHRDQLTVVEWDQDRFSLPVSPMELLGGSVG